APPTLSSSTPTDDATGRAVGSNLTLTFSEAVKAGSGNIVIHKVSDDSAVATIAIGDSSQVSISGSTVTINPTADLAAGTAYYVTHRESVVLGQGKKCVGGVTTSTPRNINTVGDDESK